MDSNVLCQSGSFQNTECIHLASCSINLCMICQDPVITWCLLILLLVHAWEDQLPQVSISGPPINPSYLTCHLRFSQILQGGYMTSLMGTQALGQEARRKLSGVSGILSYLILGYCLGKVHSVEERGKGVTLPPLLHSV